jgi:hypothetical protein
MYLITGGVRRGTKRTCSDWHKVWLDSIITPLPYNPGPQHCCNIVTPQETLMVPFPFILPPPPPPPYFSTSFKLAPLLSGKHCQWSLPLARSCIKRCGALPLPTDGVHCVWNNTHHDVVRSSFAWAQPLSQLIVFIITDAIHDCPQTLLRGWHT